MFNRKYARMPWNLRRCVLARGEIRVSNVGSPPEPTAARQRCRNGHNYESRRGAIEMKFDGYRMHARFDAGRVQILTRRSLSGDT
jgi:ATP-dependent DNA ligase